MISELPGLQAVKKEGREAERKRKTTYFMTTWRRESQGGRQGEFCL